MYGGAQRFWLMARVMGDQRYTVTTRISVNSKHALAPNIMMFQMGFAVITAAIVCGSFAERMRLRSMLVFITLWHLLVYCPVAGQAVIARFPPPRRRAAAAAALAAAHAAVNGRISEGVRRSRAWCKRAADPPPAAGPLARAFRLCCRRRG